MNYHYSPIQPAEQFGHTLAHQSESFNMHYQGLPPKYPQQRKRSFEGT